MNKETKLRDYRVFIVGIIVVAIVITILFVPMIPAKEAYNKTEEYEREAKYEVVSVDSFSSSKNESTVVIKNIDAYGGTFTVTHYLYDGDELYRTKTTGEYLSAGQNKTFRAEFDTQGLQDVRGGYSASAPTVIDRRVVTEYRIVYKSLIELLIYG